ncbi:type I restriction enzyme EcoKI subunit R [Clostridiales bacterium CHKCI006]|nr:type I restriction enzyme EcoKI subunit R [Clostridiales bacterium CHKCI006]
MWDGVERGLITIPFPEAIKQKLQKYQRDDIDYIELDKEVIKRYIKKKHDPNPTTENISGLYDYQLEAITNWKAHNYRGIFDMATGTGKTFTACGAICELFKQKKRLFVVICCPYIHLVDQWCDEVLQFNIKPIKCYGSIEYKASLNRAVYDFKSRRTNFVCVIITNQTFVNSDNQKLLQINKKNTLIIVDEAHNFGALNISQTMNVDYRYRLALSATLDRYGDPIGTKKLYEFFGEKCIEYDLARAMREKKLTPYKYFPVVVSLTELEWDRYIELSKKIKKFKYNHENEMPEGLKRLLIARARIVSGAVNKIDKLKELMINYKHDYDMLVYCGAVRYGQYDYGNCLDEKKQIELVTKMLTEDLDMVVSKFTAEEDTDTRMRLISAFRDHEIQALVAIKCLDEGMNIPAIKTCFILASSTNPKEYIQRRGRVLRKSEGKKYAEIYDFITLPMELSKASSISSPFHDIEVQLVKREFERLKDFANLSSNPSFSNDVIDQIKNAYDLDVINDLEDYLI